MHHSKRVVEYVIKHDNNNAKAAHHFHARRQNVSRWRQGMTAA